MNSKLQVTFVRFFGAWVWAFSGDYWVIDLGKNYEYSVVGDPTQEFLWILSRKPSMSKSKVREIRTLIEDKGYDSCKVLMSRSDSNGISERTPLCELN
ncbi:MAG: lipocalin family protein [Bdellovibrionales bacterium]|nr:lipocalin family protein [Bdellovibrionales bacterium]